MIPAELVAHVATLHEAPARLVYAFAGAGSLALYWLHAVPGSSRTVLEAVDAYAPASLALVLDGRAPGAKAVSPEVARALAEVSYGRAQRLAGASPVLGLSCTAAIQTDRARRGEDHALVATHSAQRSTLYHLHLSRTERDRASQEEQIGRLVLRAALRACGAEGPALSLLPGERLDAHE